MSLIVRFRFFIVLFVLSLFCNAQQKGILSSATTNFAVSPVSNPQQAITNVLFGGCVNLSNITFSGAPLQIGYFVDHSGTFGIDSGLVLTTGSIDSIAMPNTRSSTSSFYLNSLGDPLLSQISGNSTFDAAVIEFDFTPQSDTLIGCEFIFASEEYPEYVNSSFNDAYGFFISGNGISGYQNLALIPGTTTPITVNNINAQSNSQYFIDNTGGSLLSFDGYTTPFPITYQVIPNGAYHFKISIADVFDRAWDAAVFIKGGSFFGNEPLAYSDFTYSNLGGNTVDFFNLSTGADAYSWDFDDGQQSIVTNPTHTYSSSGTYNVRLTANNYCYSQDTIIQVNVTVGINEVSALNDIQWCWQTDEDLVITTGKLGGNLPEILVYSFSGSLICSSSTFETGNQIHLDFSGKPAGIYFITISDGFLTKTIETVKWE
jgi:PKD repeat protein